MKKVSVVPSYFLLFVFSILLWGACSKDDEVIPNDPQQAGIRYQDMVFTEVTESKEVQYGANTNQAGVNVNLLMNIYEPKGDMVSERPLIILAHGGGFVTGAKEDFDDLAKAFAQSGYVAATIDYRLLNGIDGDLQLAVIDAVHDMKAAVRYFTIDNKFRINPNNIFIGGFSAGAVTALHYAYFNEEDVPTASESIQSYLSANGGLSGSSGHPGASEAIKGVINIAGGLFTVNWVGANEPILYSIHGSMDVDVYCTKDPMSQSNPNGDFTEGTCLIHPALDALGITNLFRKIENGDHGAYFTCMDCDAEMRKFIFDNL
ncbi:MAG: alpha/beta hydrolase [Bacteroidota bacterium]